MQHHQDKKQRWKRIYGTARNNHHVIVKNLSKFTNCDFSFFEVVNKVITEGCRTSASVCLSVRSHISKTTSTIYEIFRACCLWPNCSVLLKRQCTVLCTCNFVDDVIFSSNRPYGCNTSMVNKCCSLSRKVYRVWPAGMRRTCTTCRQAVW